MARALRFCFYAMLRPGEFQKACRQDLVLPCDLCRTDADPRLYLSVVLPKTRLTGARKQYARADDLETARLWAFLAGDAEPQGKLWSASPTAFRTRWNLLCKEFQVPFNEVSGITPASLRAGGATALYEATEDMELVRHRGRWATVKTVEIYVQEVGGERFLASLDASVRRKIADAARDERELLYATIGDPVCEDHPRA